MFFQKEDNKAIIRSFLDLQLLKEDENKFFESDMADANFDLLKTSANIIKNTFNYPVAWDNYTKLNIGLYGEQFLDCIKKVTNTSVNNDHICPHIQNLYLNSLRFFFEIDFMLKEGEDEHEGFKKSISGMNIKKEAVSNTINELFDNEFKLELLYIINSTPLLITKNLFHSEQIKLFSTFDEKRLTAEETLNNIASSKEEITKKISDFQTELEQKEQTVENLQATLDKQETAFNFVGLYKGFNELAKRKQKEATNTFCFLIVLAFSLIAFPLSAMISIYNPNDISQSSTISTHLLNLLPLISLEIILLYFFRVVLHNYKSIKAQVLQVELRQTLCQFIQNYADYSKEIKKDDPAVLEKFENLIFSGIISDAENLPSTFDGMDQITKLLSSLKRT
ncbi:hypothetical protein AN391_01902 [Pseudoalteromonas sp. P1-13-1a]|uniref:hypothetical protein n=1 Tax=Pseudoalteromonas sp. P1-13-1a TaxID=1723756 RepID=UPI0006D68670|nr:hypothetical protein [Pseudoalteromonas sp. P1-13-1a]KPZ57315.1 hypothetical protein AN391_01902 [Pseudoalteromonas sp. P1-13-1a]